MLVLYGPPGLAKSQYALEHYPELYALPPPQRGSYWFDKYEGQETVLIEDYGTDPSELIGWSFFLRLLDGYLMQVPYKGGHYWFKPLRIILTSNRHPQEWYPHQVYEALERRITHLYEFVRYKTYFVRKQPSQRQGEGAATLIPWLNLSVTQALQGSTQQQEGPQEGQARDPVPSPSSDQSSSSYQVPSSPNVDWLLSDEVLANGDDV